MTSEHDAAPTTADEEPIVAFLVQLGAALVLSGEAVDEVRVLLLGAARMGGSPDVDIVVLPTVLMIQAGQSRDARIQIRSVVSSSKLRLDQVSAVYELAARAGRERIDPQAGLIELERIRTMRAPFGPAMRTLGLGVLSAGFALALQPTPFGVLSAFGLGILVGLVLLIRVPELQAVLPVLVSFTVAAAVFALAQHYDGENPIRSLIPPLVVFLPGAAITTGTMELAAGQTISGASRLVEGLVDLMLLAFGIVAAAALVGVPASDLLDRPVERLGVWTVPLALVAIAIGNHLHMCAPRRTVPWILLVLAVAFGGQAAGAAVFSAELSGFFGALAMTPLVLTIGRHPKGPPAMVLFLPAFWLLVPGAAGLIGVTAIVGTDSRLGAADFTATMMTVLAISLGVLMGTAAVRAATQMQRRARSGLVSVGWIRE